MKYKLNTGAESQSKKKGVLVSIKERLLPLLLVERIYIVFAFLAIVVTSASSLIAPVLIAKTIDTAIANGDMGGVWVSALLLLGVFLVGLVSSYLQVRLMGGVGRRVLFQLRNKLFSKLGALPVSFFNQNKSGDLISRINNDTDKLNQFFSQALIQFVGNGVMIVGAGMFLVIIHPALGVAALVPALVVLGITQWISPWMARTSLGSLQKLGGLSGEIQESLTNFKVVVAFNRLDYFRDRFREVNDQNYHASVRAGIASGTLNPLYGLASTGAQLIVVVYGVSLISAGDLTIGALIGYLLYVSSFYMPLRQLAAVWASMQTALAGLDRIMEVLVMESDMAQLEKQENVTVGQHPLLQFRDVSFQYDDSVSVLRNIQMTLEAGKTYALVGPTGGGKTTTAFLMSRLYDPTSGEIYFHGHPLQSYSAEERSQKIGFILQEPFLFSGTLAENILYGNKKYSENKLENIESLFVATGLDTLLSRFPDGLNTRVVSTGDGLSLGQKQLIAFMRAVLRDPELLILDEATANVDTVTEQLLEHILLKLPASTTKVIIAHRLNTIENADEIYFVNGGTIIRAGNKEEALELLIHRKRAG